MLRSVKATLKLNNFERQSRYTGSFTHENFTDYEICAAANAWQDDKMAAFKLPTMLNGVALIAWLGIPVKMRADYAARSKP